MGDDEIDDLFNDPSDFIEDEDVFYLCNACEYGWYGAGDQEECPMCDSTDIEDHY